MRRRFYQVDVFGSEPFTGNPLAVVLDAEGLSTEEMKAFACWTNLSETAFILPPQAKAADYRVRIFSLDTEYPFAGHPTLGSCQAWLVSGGQPKRDHEIVQECGAGLVPIRRTEAGLAFAAPPSTRSEPIGEQDLVRLAGILNIHRADIIDGQWTSEWASLLLREANAVLSIEPVRLLDRADAELNIGIIGPYREGSECAFEVRALFNDWHGTLREDPATGSLNASLAQWLFATGRAISPYKVSQGTRLGRKSRLEMSIDADDQVWVAGSTMVCIRGEVDC